MTILRSPEDIAGRVEELGRAIAGEAPQDLLLAPILTGAFVFAADLARALYRNGLDCDVDFLHLSSYGDARETSGKVRLVKDLQSDVRGRNVLLVDDVFDSGMSLGFAREHLSARGAESVRVCVLVDKQTGRSKGPSPDYVGFHEEPDAFLIGYGMDDAGRYRGCPHIGVVE